MFPAPSGDTLSDALNGLTLRAQTYLPDAGQRPLLLILSRGAPAKTLGRVLSYLPRAAKWSWVWDRGIRVVSPLMLAGLEPVKGPSIPNETSIMNWSSTVFCLP